MSMIPGSTARTAYSVAEAGMTNPEDAGRRAAARVTRPSAWTTSGSGSPDPDQQPDHDLRLGFYGWGTGSRTARGDTHPRDDRRGPRRYAELLVDMSEVVLHGLLGEEQAPGDLTV